MTSASIGTSEVWKPVSIWDGKYEVSSLGRVRNASSKRLLKACVSNRGGYLCVYAWMDGKTVARNVHRLVAEAFLPNPDDLPCVNHLNGDYQDPRLANLEWCTHRQNTHHAINSLGRTFAKNLRCGKGVESGASRLSEADVLSIRRLAATGHAQKEIAERFGTSKSNVRSIVRRLTWSHV